MRRFISLLILIFLLLSGVADAASTNVQSFTAPLRISLGGTNATSFTSGYLPYFDGERFVISPISTDGSVVTITRNSSATGDNLIIRNSATTGNTVSSSIGFSTYTGSTYETIGFVGSTSSAWSYGEFPPNMTYLEGYGTGGVLIEATHPSSGGILFYTGGLSSSTYERMQITHDGKIGFGSFGARAIVGKFHFDTYTGGIHGGIAVDLPFEHADATSRYTGIDFIGYTTGYIGQFLMSGNTYNSGGAINLPANSLSLWAEAVSGSLVLGAGGTNGDIRFNTGGYGLANERMRILADGKVGIGTNNPLVPVEIRNASPQFLLGLGTSEYVYAYYLGIVGTTSPDLIFSTTTGFETMRLSTSGYVGIRVVPYYPIQVSTGYVKTDATLRNLFMLGSNEGMTSDGLKILWRGAAAQADRLTAMQTGDGSTNDGILSMQAWGGKVGIGTTAPSSLLTIKDQIRISRTSDEYGFVLKTATDGSSLSIGYMTTANTWFLGIPQIIIDTASGNVGIGTTTLLNKLSVYTTTSADGISVDGTNNPAFISKSGGVVRGYWTTATIDTSFFTNALTNDMIFRTETANSRILLGVGSGVSTVTITPIAVGIGTGSPGAITPNGWAANGKLLEIKTSGALADAGLLLTRSDGATASHIWHSGSTWSLYIDNYYDGDAANIYFRTKTSGTPVNAMTILGGGNVGIGTTVPTELLDVKGNMKYSGTTGGLVRKTAEATCTTTAATTCVITLSIPTGVRLLGAQLRVDTALTAGDTWSAAYSGGSTTTIAAAGRAVAKDTKVNKLHVDEITTNTTNITVTRDAGSFTAGGVIRGIVYYETLEAMANAP